MDVTEKELREKKVVKEREERVMNVKGRREGKVRKRSNKLRKSKRGR